MLLLSSGFASLLQCFAPLFDSRVWNYARLLLIGAMLAPGKRTVTSVLRIVGRGNEQRFQNYHRVLNLARWNRGSSHMWLLPLEFGHFLRAGGESGYSLIQVEPGSCGRVAHPFSGSP